MQHVKGFHLLHLDGQLLSSILGHVFLADRNIGIDQFSHPVSDVTQYLLIQSVGNGNEYSLVKGILHVYQDLVAQYVMNSLDE